MSEQTSVVTKEEAEQAKGVAISSLREMRMMKKNKKKIKKNKIRSIIDDLSTSLERLSPGNPLAAKARNFIEATKEQEAKD